MTAPAFPTWYRSLAAWNSASRCRKPAAECLSPDGQSYVYTPIDREFRTWKRTRGGRAQEVWIYDLKNNESKRLTDFNGTDNQPIWVGDSIYFASDREYTLNLC